jgi:putative membrane protein
MKGAAVFGLIAGLLLAMALVIGNDAGAVWRSAALLGFHGLVVVAAFHLVLIGLMGGASWQLGSDRRDAALGRFVWGRLVRDSASEALPLSQIGGYVFGARAVALTGVSGSFAAASTVVDVSVELVAQLVYTAFGLWLLRRLSPDNAFAAPVLGGILVMGVLAAIFIAVQARGAGWVERAGSRLTREFLGRELAAADSVQAGIRRIHARRPALAVALAAHLASWVLSGVETWLTLRLMGVALPLEAALVVDSLLYGMRSVAFMVPNSLGVQEGALVLLGGMFGVGPDSALALSLAKRARDLLIGAPTLLIWQAIEGRRAWSGGMPLDTEQVKPSSSAVPPRSAVSTEAAPASGAPAVPRAMRNGPVTEVARPRPPLCGPTPHAGGSFAGPLASPAESGETP